MRDGAASWHFARWAYETPNLTSAQKSVLVCLAWHVNEEYAETFVSQAELARKTSLSERTVRQALKELQERGLIHRTERRTRNRRTSDLTVLPDLTSLSPSSREPEPVAGSPDVEPARVAGEPTTTSNRERGSNGSAATAAGREHGQPAAFAGRSLRRITVLGEAA